MQQLLDCVVDRHALSPDTCDGASLESALRYVYEKGLCLEKDYRPYSGTREKCQRTACDRVRTFFFPYGIVFPQRLSARFPRAFRPPNRGSPRTRPRHGGREPRGSPVLRLRVQKSAQFSARGVSSVLHRGNRVFVPLGGKRPFRDADASLVPPAFPPPPLPRSRQLSPRRSPRFCAPLRGRREFAGVLRVHRGNRAAPAVRAPLRV